MAPKMGQVLARFDFPLYTLQFIDDKHFLVAGGGGGAKTGIPNAVEVRKWRILEEEVEEEEEEPRQEYQMQLR